MMTRIGLAVWLTAVGQLGAQAPEVEIGRGQLVRVTTLKGQTSGRLLIPYKPSAPTVLFCESSDRPCGAHGDSTGARRVQSAEMLRMEVRSGTGAKTGAIIGGLSGAVGGALLFMVAEEDKANSGMIGGGLIGGLVGALPGALIGSLFVKWNKVP